MAEMEQFEHVLGERRHRFPGLRSHVGSDPHPALAAAATSHPSPASILASASISKASARNFRTPVPVPAPWKRAPNKHLTLAAP